MEENRDEISLLEIWNRIWKNKFLVIIITAIFVIVGTLLLTFYSRSKATLKSEFNYQFVNVENEKYPDGSIFDYRNIATVDFLSSIVQSDPSFKNINLESLVSNSAFAVVKKDILLANTQTVIDSYYELTVPLKLFGNDSKLAEKFILSIHNKIVNKAKNANNLLGTYNYLKNDLTDIDNNDSIEMNLSNLTYLEVLGLISKQYQVLTSEMQSFINTYGDIHINNESIVNLKRVIESWYQSESLISNIEFEIRDKGYVRNLGTTKLKAQLELTALKQTVLLNEKAILYSMSLLDELKTSNLQDIDIILNELISKNKQNDKIKLDILYLESIINATSDKTNKDIDDRLSYVTAKLTEQTNKYNTFKMTYLNDTARYLPHGEKEFVVNAPFGLIMSVILTGILGGIIAVSSALIKEAVINNKTSKKENQEA